MAKKFLYRPQKTNAYGIYRVDRVFGSAMRQLLKVEFKLADAKAYADRYIAVTATSAKLMVEPVEVKLGGWDGTMPSEKISVAI